MNYKIGDIVTLRNGDRLIYKLGYFHDLNPENINLICDLDDIKNDLTFYGGTRDYDIVKVERPTTYGEVFVREEKEKKRIPDNVRESMRIMKNFCNNTVCSDCPFRLANECGLKMYNPLGNYNKYIVSEVK